MVNVDRPFTHNNVTPANDEDQLLCTVYSALINYVNHFNLLPAHHKINIPSPKRSPIKKQPRRIKVLGKRRGSCEEDDDFDLTVTPQPEYKRPHLMGGSGQVYSPVLPVCREDDPYMDSVSVTREDAERCIRSLAALCRALAADCNIIDLTNTILLAWINSKSVDYEQLVYLLESLIALNMIDQVDPSHLNQTIIIFLNREIALLKLFERKSQRLAVFVDVYRIFSRLNTHRLKWTSRVQQLGCELILQCFESVASKPASWSVHFAVAFCSLHASCLFPHKSAYYQSLCDVCETVVSM